MGQSTTRDYEKSRLIHQRIDDNPPLCEWCHREIPKPRRYQPLVKYCDVRCRDKASHKRLLERNALASIAYHAAKVTDLYPEADTRAGPLYQVALDNLDAVTLEAWVDHKISDVKISKLLGEGTPQALGRVRKALFNERVNQAAAVHHQVDAEAARLLGPSDEQMQELAARDRDAFETALDDLVDAFVAWRTRFFVIGHKRPYITRPMHRTWIRATLQVIYLGERLLVLSPPRHGKSDLLIHFCVWQIIRNPGVQILWVGPNSEIAENCLGQVRDLLETHEDLQAAYLPKGQSWAPTRRGGNLWAKDKFTVSTRLTPQKQPTMWCSGVEGRLQSIDADFIVVDDPADPDRSYTPGGRDKIENWFKQKLITRKMDHTGLAMISSRVHSFDLYSNFIDSPAWKVITDRAHDSSICGHELFYGTEADHLDCVLFPEINPLGYLRQQADDVGPALFEMMYLNQPRPEGSLIFDPELIRANCLDHSRDLGIGEIPGTYRLVAGLDPAAKGYQAGFCWAIHLPSFDPDYNPADSRQADREPSYHMVDLENQKAGGIEGAELLMEDWYLRYGLKTWVVEDNAYQTTFFDDPRIKALEVKYGLDIRPAHTGRNKHDRQFGVAGQAGMYHKGQVVLPYATPEAVRKVDMLINQLVNFTGGPSRTANSTNKSDILMASWFPFAELVRRWHRENKAFTVRQESGESFPGYIGPSFESVPWGQTTYFPTTPL